ncbi:MAG TPA: ribosome biogenesis GTPase Der, partial [Planctomycetota bacterium]|nr:ribosome biogenesis GTPase Der [Planctomycetota bacterium]
DVTMEVFDTGGIGIVDVEDLSEHIEHQIQAAVSGANVILFVTDGREGVTALDRTVAERLRPRAAEIPVLLVVNKIDDPHLEPHILDFWELGLGEPHPVSAMHGYGRGDILEEIVSRLGPTGDVSIEPVMTLAVIGRQNAGKSTFVNALAREERVIVSEVPGTTRDAVDVRFERDGREFLIIDTAGVQRKSRVKDSIEFYSQARTERSIRRANVVLFILDSREEITRVEKRLAQTIVDQKKICVIVANKWDLVADKLATEEYSEYVAKTLPGLHYAPIVFTTATEGRHVHSVIDVAQSLFNIASRRVGTGELNRVVEAVRQHHQPRVKKSKVPKIYFATQVSVLPPTIVLFVNDPDLFDASYRRYVENAFREALSFEEVPIRLFFRERESKYHE